MLDEVRRGRVTIGEDAPAEAPSADGMRVETAYLQLVMQRIWDEETTAGSRLLRVETLRRLGGAGTIVRAHVDDALTGMPDPEQDAASEALRFLVTSGGRKIALSTTELREFTDVPAEPLESALERLERNRILRPVAASEQDGAVRRELYHDVLAPAVLDWRRRHVESGSGRRPTGSWRRPADARGCWRSATAASRRRSSRSPQRSSGSVCICSIPRGCSALTSGPSMRASPCRTATPPIPGWRSSRWTTRR